MIVTVKDHSMEPTIRDGSVLLVSTSATQAIDREIYAFRADNELFAKRFVKVDGTILAVSDNPDQTTFKPMRIEGNDPGIEIIGRALWMGARL